MKTKFYIKVNSEKIPIRVNISNSEIKIGQMLNEYKTAHYKNGVFEIPETLSIKTNKGVKNLSKIKCPKNIKWKVEECLNYEIKKRPNKEDFKPKYINGEAEISSVIKQYSRAQDEYIDYLEEQLQNLSKLKKYNCHNSISIYNLEDYVLYKDLISKINEILQK